MFIETLEFKRSRNYIGPFFHLLQYFRTSPHPDSKEIPSEIIKDIYLRADNLVEDILSSMSTLAKFLNVGVQDTNVGIIGEWEVMSMSNHIEFLTYMSSDLLGIKTNAQMELLRRGVAINK